ncbi:MAG: hypothetical protein FJ138_06875 [Deltaproteobacteria bacterium]|nr:hypothetical protein [Deltaproteobacteria bacterium]
MPPSRPPRAPRAPLSASRALLQLTSAALAASALTLAACEDDDPKTTPPAAGTAAGADAGTAAGTDAGTTAGADAGAEPPPVCEPAPTDYPGATWGACVSDGGRYELAGASTPSSAARTAAFERIADLLWRNPALTAESFVQAELIYAEPEGLQSRVARRYDSHVAAPDGANCTLPEAPARWPEYCVGPAAIDPLLGAAFAAGNQGQDLAANAERVRAGLLWFLYVSVYKEANTCATKAADCDSSWAYDNAGKQRDEAPLALGAWVQAASPEAYDALFTAHLAVRCWRDLDSAETATNMELMGNAVAQLDRALDGGYARGLRAELSALAGLTGAEAAARRAGLKVLGLAFTRAQVAAAPSTDAAAWAAAWEGLGAAEGAALSAQLEAAFPCP